MDVEGAAWGFSLGLQQASQGKALFWLKKPLFGSAADPSVYHLSSASPLSIPSISLPSQLPQCGTQSEVFTDARLA